MTIQEKIENDFGQALKEKEEIKKDTLRGIKTAITFLEKEKRGKISDQEILEVIRKEIKKREEARGLYLEGKRAELAEKEEREITILKQYLPKQLTDIEIEKEIIKTIKSLGVKGMEDFGKVMGTVMKKLVGKVNGARVAEIVKEILSKNL